MKGYQKHSVKVCGDCRHFRRHYVLMYEDHYAPTDFGHCVHPRLKDRRAEEHCPRWEPIETEENACDS